MTIQNFNWKADHRLWCGASGTGKTTHFLKTLKAEKARLKFVFDWQGEFSRKLGIAPCFTVDQLCAATARGGWIIFDPVRLGNIPATLEMFCRYVFEVGSITPGRKLFCCDELGKVTGNSIEPENLVTLLETGRRYSIDTFCIAQGANQIHNRIRQQWTQVTAFRHADTTAIKPLAALGMNENEIRELRPGEYVWRKLNTGETGKGGKAF